MSNYTRAWNMHMEARIAEMRAYFNRTEPNLSEQELQRRAQRLRAYYTRVSNLPNSNNAPAFAFPYDELMRFIARNPVDSTNTGRQGTQSSDSFYRNNKASDPSSRRRRGGAKKKTRKSRGRTRRVSK